MKAIINVELKPLEVPNWVSSTPVTNNGVNWYKLKSLSPDILEKLCEEFTNSVFEKAGKCRPPTNNHRG